jgi:hypothetical protein
VLERLTVDDFAPAVGEVFVVRAAEVGPLDLELTSALTQGGRPAIGPDGVRSPFALHFRGPREPVLPQAIYRLDHESLGTLEIFIVPTGPDGGDMRYEAIFA